MTETPAPLPPRGFRWRGFADAARGVGLLLRTQPNARIHLLATIAATVMGAWLKLSPGEWAALFLAMALVWVAEALNTAVEFTVNLASPEHRQLAGWAKDAAAAAVLLAALAAAAVGLVLFGSRLWPA